jgi:hypothetical protein
VAGRVRRPGRCGDRPVRRPGPAGSRHRASPAPARGRGGDRGHRRPDLRLGAVDRQHAAVRARLRWPGPGPGLAGDAAAVGQPDHRHGGGPGPVGRVGAVGPDGPRHRARLDDRGRKSAGLAVPPRSGSRSRWLAG